MRDETYQRMGTLGLSRSELGLELRGDTDARCRDCGGHLDLVWHDSYHCENCGSAATPATRRGAPDAPHLHPIQYAPGPAWQGVTRTELRRLVAESLDGCAQHELRVRAGDVRLEDRCPVCLRQHGRDSYWRCGECARGIADGMRFCFACRPPSAASVRS